jgi:hypothetical protein
MTPQNAQDRNRLDHILPRAYLEGFTIPSKEERLYAFNIEQRRWFETGTGNVAASHGFYDYSLDSQPDATADQAFKEFEDSFPPLRRDLLATNFSYWTKHRDFLVKYSQMLRARSTLFREQVLKQADSSTFLTLGEVLQTRPSVDRPGEIDAQYRYSDFKPENDERRDALFKNLSITEMRAEIAKGAGKFTGWHWCLRFTMDVARPLITSDNAVGLIGFGPPSLGEAMMHPESLFVFPLCWQARLIGSPRKFDVETDAIAPSLLGEFQRLYLNENDCRFAYSPHPVTF